MRIEIQEFEYDHGDKRFAAYVAKDADRRGKRPGVAIVHEWLGPGENVKRRARMLAELGYVGVAIDMYGVGTRPRDAAEAAVAMNAVLADRPALRARMQRAIAVVRADADVDPKQVAAIGYCFGGGCVLELARAGADVLGVVSFHGALSTTQPATVRPRAKVLVLHGAEDPFVDAAKVADFMNEMRAVAADWQLVHYGGAVHSFTNPQASDPAAGFAFDPKADARSWQQMRAFLAELFA